MDTNNVVPSFGFVDISAPACFISAAFPTASRFPSTVPDTPLPRAYSKLVATDSVSPLSAAAATTADASGCSLARSRLAARRRSSFSRPGSTLRIASSFGLPSVSVPVLSTTSVSTFSKISSASAFLISTPACAPRPVPTMIAMGVARPRAQGQAMM